MFEIINLIPMQILGPAPKLRKAVAALWLSASNHLKWIELHPLSFLLRHCFHDFSQPQPQAWIAQIYIYGLVIYYKR